MPDPRVDEASALLDNFWQRNGVASALPRLRAQLQTLMQYLPLRDQIEIIWRDPEQQRATTWIEQRDINEVMLATSLAPDGFLVLLPPDGWDLKVGINLLQKTINPFKHTLRVTDDIEYQLKERIIRHIK